MQRETEKERHACICTRGYCIGFCFVCSVLSVCDSWQLALFSLFFLSYLLLFWLRIHRPWLFSLLFSFLSFSPFSMKCDLLRILQSIFRMIVCRKQGPKMVMPNDPHMIRQLSINKSCHDGCWRRISSLLILLLLTACCDKLVSIPRL